MKSLIVGGAGFIGSNLAEELAKFSEITILDNLHTGSKNNLIGIPHTFVNQSLRDFNLNSVDFDNVFYLGMPSSTPMYRSTHSLVGITINEAIKLFDFCATNQRKVIFASSSSLYNKNPGYGSELMEIYPTDYYTEVRYSMERFCKFYQETKDLQWQAMRFFSVYGPKEKYKGVYANMISQFIWSMMKNEPPVIYGDGTQTRDFIYITDVVKAITMAMKSNESGIYNVGTGANYSFNDIVKIINDRMGTKIVPVYNENPIDNYVRDTRASIAKTMLKLGFRSEVCVNLGIEKLIRYYEDQI